MATVQCPKRVGNSKKYDNDNDKKSVLSLKAMYKHQLL